MSLPRPSFALDIQLPDKPPTSNAELLFQLQYLYNSVKIIAAAHAELREEYDAYVLAHP